MKKIYLILILAIFVPIISFAKINDVAFISQVLPGNWNYTLNCGQTSYYMVLSYINGVKDEEILDFNEIKKIDDWLYEKYGDPIRDYNGYYTDINKLNTMAKERNNIENSGAFSGENKFSELMKEIDNNNIVIVAVRINMNISKEGHFMVLVGYDNKYVYLNDPGKMLGKKRRYLIQYFLDSWKTQNYSYVLIKNEDKNKEAEIKIEEEVAYGYGIANDKKIILTPEDNLRKNNVIGIVSNDLKNKNILFNETVENENGFLQTVIRDNEDQLQIISVDGEFETANNKFEENKNVLEGSGIEIAYNNFPFLDENNWMHVGENLIIDYNIPKNIKSDNRNDQVEDSNIDNDSDKTFGGDSEEDDAGDLFEDETKIPDDFEEKNVGDSSVLDDEFEFNGQYINNSLTISLLWTNPKDFLLNLDIKIGYGDWESLYIGNDLLNYDYYIKENNTKYYFRLRAFDGEKYSNYKIIEQEVVIEPLLEASSLEEINTDTILGKNRTYFCNKDCVLNKGVNLLVEDGVKIKMARSTSFMFLGNVFFMGEYENKIYIAPNNSENKAGDMGFIYFYENEFVELNSVDIGYGGYVEFPGKVGDMIKVDNVKSFIINNSHFHDTYLASGANMNVVNSVVKIKNSKFLRALYGFKIASSSGEIIENEFGYSHYNFGLYNVDKNLKVYNNRVFNGINMAIFGQNIFADIKENVLENNKFNLISMTLLNIDSGIFTLSKGIYNIYEANIGEGATLNIENGTIFKSYTDHGRFKVDGKIIMNSLPSDPIIFTSFFDDSYGGDSNLDGNTFLPKVGDWGYLEFSEKSYGSVINNVIFKYGGNYNFMAINHGVIYVNGGKNINIENSIFDKGFYRNIEIDSGSDINIKNNKILNSNIYGIDIRSGYNILISNNEFVGNKSAGVCYKASDSIVLENNLFKNNMSNVVIIP